MGNSAKKKHPPQDRPHPSLWRMAIAAFVGFLAVMLSRTKCPAAPVAVRTPFSGLRHLQEEEPTPDYERREASVGWVFTIVAILAVSGVVMHLLLGGYLRHLNRQPGPADTWQPITPPAKGFVAPVTAFPRLQVAPSFDLAGFRQKEEARLNSYGWVDQSSGRAHIPISAAMDLLLKKGLPVRSGTNSQTEKPGPSTYDVQLDRVQRWQAGKEGP